jgi:hypothetical protein
VIFESEGVRLFRGINIFLDGVGWGPIFFNDSLFQFLGFALVAAEFCGSLPAFYQGSCKNIMCGCHGVSLQWCVEKR